MAKPPFDNDFTALLPAILAEWGGAAQLARELREEFTSLTARHPNRVKILITIVQLAAKFGTSTPDDDPLEIKREKLKQLLAQYHGDDDSDDSEDEWNDDNG